MKIITKYILSLPIYFLSFSGSFDALAAERYTVFEFGEGDHSVSFPMSKDEIEKEDARLSKLKMLKEKREQIVVKWVQIFEFGESGHTVEFPMTKKEIEEAKTLRKRLKKIPEKPADDDVESYEMADGNIIVFEKSPSRILLSQLGVER